MGDAVTKLKDIEQQKDIHFKDQNQELSQIRDQNTVLTKELEKLKQELFALKNGSKSDVNIKSENLNENNVENPLNPLNNNNVENPLNPLNDNNLIKTNDTLKGVEETLKAEINSMDSKNNIQEPVIAEPVKPNQMLPSNGLAEEDRKEESMLEANEANNNEIGDDLKADPNKDVEDSKL